MTETARADIPLTTINSLANGTHSILVHGKDAAGNWGATSSVVLTIDRTRPTVSTVAVTPSPTHGALTVNLTASASDTQTAITRAEWFIGADPGVGNATAMTVSGTGPYSLAAAIDVASRPPGNYVISVRARDAASNWSLLGTTTLTVSPLTFSTVRQHQPAGRRGHGRRRRRVQLERHRLQPGLRRQYRRYQCRRQRRRSRAHRRHPLLHFLRRQHDDHRPRRRAGRGHRLLQRWHVVGLLRRHSGRSDRRRPGHRRVRHRRRRAPLLDVRQHQPAGRRRHRR